MQLVKMGVPRDFGRDAIEFMFYGQLHHENAKARADFWQQNRGTSSPSRAQRAPLWLRHCHFICPRRASIRITDRSHTPAGKRQIAPLLSAKIFRVAGLPLLREANQGWQNFGVYLLESAVHLGDLAAALHLCALENRKARFKNTIPQKARDLVQARASAGNDWKALAVRAEYLMSFKDRPTKLKEAFELAKLLIEATEPNPDSPNEGPEEIPLIEPWRVLWHAARLNDDTEAQAKAVQIGATQYHNPEACWWWANSKDVEAYSEPWVDLMTKAAMGGQNRACYDLGMYWLEKKGWYPCPTRLVQPPTKVSLDAESSLGFDWLEVAALGRSPPLAAELFLGMALVFRENDCSQRGLDCLENGVDAIQAAPGDPPSKADAINKLGIMIKDWSNTEVPQAGQTRLKGVWADPKAADFLPPPRMPLNLEGQG
jgi:hypothetical protein